MGKPETLSPAIEAGGRDASILRGQALGQAQFIPGHFRKEEQSEPGPFTLPIAPEDFSPFSKRLIVGNFGDGMLVAFGLKRGRQRGYLRGRDRQAIQINGLWGLAFGNGARLGRAIHLYFTAGPNGEAAGLFGGLHFVDE